MSPLLIIVILLLIFGLPGGWYAYNTAGPWGGVGVGLVVIILLVVLILGYR